jgi:uroporphyrinogen-III decarboxylase
MGTKWFREYLKPRLKIMYGRVHELGKYVYIHSCGDNSTVIEDLIEIGVDALNCQVRAMGEETLAERFRGRICFWGELDRQEVLPFGTPDEVRVAAARMMKLFARPEGGFISQFELGQDVPEANLRAALETFATWKP